MAKKLDTHHGEFIGLKVDDDHLTLWVEGRDQDGPSVSGTALDGDQLEELINLLLVYKINHFRVRTRDSRKDDRRQSDKTEKKLKELYPEKK